MAATTSAGQYIVEGTKISLDLLQDISDALPGPAKAVINLVKRIVDTADVRITLGTHPSHLTDILSRLSNRIKRTVGISRIASFGLRLSS